MYFPIPYTHTSSSNRYQVYPIYLFLSISILTLYYKAVLDIYVFDSQGNFKKKGKEGTNGQEIAVTSKWIKKKVVSKSRCYC